MVQVQQRIEDAALREQTFERRKHELIRQAMELSILCDCDVQLFVHSAKVRVPDARARPASTQFSSDNAEALMAYVREHPPAERFGVEDYWHKFKASAPCADALRPVCAATRVPDPRELQGWRAAAAASAMLTIPALPFFCASPQEGGAPPDGDGAARPPLPPHPAGANHLPRRAGGRAACLRRERQ